MRYIPDHLRGILHDRLKAGQGSKPVARVEVDRMTFIPGYVEEMTLFDSDYNKTVEKVEVVQGTKTKTTVDKVMLFPMEGMNIGDLGTKYYKTSDYGPRGSGTHWGIDFQSMTKKANIIAVLPGKVTKIGWDGDGGGRYVKIDHGQGLTTVYMHMVKDSVVIKSGQHVSAGQKIGVEGNTGGVRGATGIHLHFETHVNGKKENPMPWLKGDKSITVTEVLEENLTDVTTETVAEDVVVGVPGAVIVNEQMNNPKWYDKAMYEPYAGSSDDFAVESIGSGNYRTYFRLKGGDFKAHQVRLKVHVTLANDGYMNFTYSGDFVETLGEYFYVTVNGKQVWMADAFKGVGKAITIKDIAVPKGDVTIFFYAISQGKVGPFSTRNAALHSFSIRELDTTRTESQVATIEKANLQNRGAVINPLIDYVERPVTVELQTGRFVYEDTLVLPYVSDVQIDRSLETDSSEATITLSNPNGMLSPDYNPYYFPELQNQQSPFSYKIQGDFHIGVLSENTPIRIYLGYGEQMALRPMRMFTGLIDSCDINGADGTLTVKARDMYKKVLNHVLLERKQYGQEPTAVPAVLPETAPVAAGGMVDPSTLNRRQLIYYHAWAEVQERSLPEIAYYFLLAICQHETAFGTIGAGAPKPDGNYVLGYGVFDSGKRSQYQGIETQMHYGAKRYKEALPSKNYEVKSLNDVKYFYKGGDKGAYQWATDTQWSEKVWKYFKDITANKKAYEPPNRMAQNPGDTDAAPITAAAPTAAATSATTNGKKQGATYETFIGTAYDPRLGGINADSNPNDTATGTIWAYNRTVAVAPKVIPYGSVIHVHAPDSNGSGIYLAEDTGGAIRNENGGKRVDLLIQGNGAYEFGRRNVEVTILEKGTGPADARAKAKNWANIKAKYEKQIVSYPEEPPTAPSLYTFPVTTKFIPGLPKKGYRNGVGNWEGIVAHATDMMEQTAESVYDHFTRFNTHQSFTHYIVDWDSILYCADKQYKCWGAGSTANARYVQIELCQSKDKNKFKASYERYTWLIAKLLLDKGLEVIQNTTVWGHNEVSEILGGTDHTDPWGYLKTHDISEAKFFDDIRAQMKAITNPPVSAAGVETTPGEYWLKTAIINDLITEAGMTGWRAAPDDLQHPDAVIEESYLIELHPKKGKMMQAVPEEEATEDMKFRLVPIESVPTPEGWKNPFVERATTFLELEWKIGDAIGELIKDTNYRSYCDRYGTYRLEMLSYNKPVTATFRHDENLITITKNIDYSRTRSHLVIYDEATEARSGNSEYMFASFIDKELLLELKGEVRTGVAVVPWAKTNAQKREVALRLFNDMKRMSRTMQISIPGNPALDIMDRIRIVDKLTATNATYFIKSIQDSFSADEGYVQVLDLTWSAQDQLMQLPGLVHNVEATLEPAPSEKAVAETPPAGSAACGKPYNGKIYKFGIKNNKTVKEIQQRLLDLGYHIPSGATGNYYSETVTAVKKLQKAKRLTVDGIVGEESWHAIFCNH